MRITQKQAIRLVQRLVAPRYTAADALAELDSFSDVAYLVPGWGCKLYSKKDALGRRRFNLRGYAPDGSDVAQTLAFIA
jgi:hypothetical protein